MRESLPLVSVIIPLFNRATLIGETLTSVCGQSYNNLEIVVVDDGSSDEGVKLVQQWQREDQRVRLAFRKDLPKGAPSCRNVGFRASTGELIIFLDSDDLLSVNCVERRVALMREKPDRGFIVSQGLIFEKTPGDKRLLWNQSNRGEGDLVARFLDQDVPWQTTGATWRRNVIQSIGLWNERLCSFQDWELHLRACLSGTSLELVDTPDFYIRRSNEDRISANHFSSHHLLARLSALESVFCLIKKDRSLFKKYRRNVKGFLLRNHVQLVDHGCHELCPLIMASPVAEELLSVLDRWLLRWIERVGPKWHWHSRVQKVVSYWWSDLPYDSNASATFMTSEWTGVMPPITGLKGV